MQILSVQYQWNGYREEESGMSKVFTMRSTSLLFHKDEAEVFMMRSGRDKREDHQNPDFKIEGCFRSRNCCIRTGNGDLVAKIARKRANSTVLLSEDVFSLVVNPGFGTDLVMAFVVILDRISRKPYTPVLCS